MFDDPRKALKVGAVLAVSITIFMVVILLIGKKEHLFRPKNRYHMYFKNVTGLNEGNPVQLNGVNIGQIKDIALPEDIENQFIKVEIEIDRKYSDRIRTDSRARIKTFGLLGDKYIFITSGTKNGQIIPNGGEIPVSQPTDVERLIASGEDVMDNILKISTSLAKILERVEKGEGFLGEITLNQQVGRKITSTLLDTLDSIKEVSDKINRGEGILAKLINSEDIATTFNKVIKLTEELLNVIKEGEGIITALLKDPEIREEIKQTITNAKETTQKAASVSDKIDAMLASSDGLIIRLLSDKKIADQFIAELEQLLSNLRAVSEKLNSPEGTAGKIISDPSIYEAINSVIIGVNESKILRFLIRNRQKKGMEKQLEEICKGM